jgi:hypothetical protein
MRILTGDDPAAFPLGVAIAIGRICAAAIGREIRRS